MKVNSMSFREPEHGAIDGNILTCAFPSALRPLRANLRLLFLQASRPFGSRPVKIGLNPVYSDHCLYRSGKWRGHWHQPHKPGIFCLTQLQICDQLLQIKVIVLRDRILVLMNFCHHFVDTLFYNFNSFHRLKTPPVCR